MAFKFLTLASDIISAEISKELVGQDEGVKKVVTAICENLESYLSGNSRKTAKNNILLVGPTGSGKTELARRISELLDLPFVRVNITDYTLTGYKGRDPQSIVLEDFDRVLQKGAYRAAEVLEEKRRKYCGAVYLLKNLKEELLKRGKGRDSLLFYLKVTAELFASMLFFEKDRVVEFLLSKYSFKNPKHRDRLKSLLEQLARKFEGMKKLTPLLDGCSGKVEKRQFSHKPFGIVFIDEIDKILIQESENSFYTWLQNFLLTMVEGTVVTGETEREVKTMDTSHLTFIFAGAFSQTSPDDFFPEFRGRLNVTVKFNELGLEELEQIARLKDFAGFMGDLFVKVEPDAYKAVAEEAFRLNRDCYLGARRVDEVISKVNAALSRELALGRLSLPVVVDYSYVKWACSLKFEGRSEAAFVELPVTGKEELLAKELEECLDKELDGEFDIVERAVFKSLHASEVLGKIERQIREELEENMALSIGLFNYYLEAVRVFKGSRSEGLVRLANLLLEFGPWNLEPDFAQYFLEEVERAAVKDRIPDEVIKALESLRENDDLDDRLMLL
ncbi:ATPase associated with various cellular activities AAA_5 [Thermovibrio ammonificans HB-1]|uniref:ATPase associated with various cellular activities AAA_5 n=1 Tax=Thermovibrio ammonificans (strain DSM 15698 / JCM 12110 / HB-1) TaxID=648996 RepID=E8T5L6_THEA1|nr:AAA family ATPase [Thermovibrio ammonificans]ADU96491.1 ATPase associated with various cellular activities AAA_5 [Thermovibrio ammonificans HB-1]